MRPTQTGRPFPYREAHLDAVVRNLRLFKPPQLCRRLVTPDDHLAFLMQ
jgi:hypothetical protein